jgi:NAD(P)H-dependent flavin oxidoreductase YrpB (nitropropane dioxygenase family)
VAAVSNVGGLGVLGAVAHTPEQLDIDLTWIAEQTKGRRSVSTC